EGAFISGFEYEWNAGKRLVDLVEEYHAYAVNMDNAIGHIKEIDAHEVKLIGYDLAENGEGDEGSQESEEIEEEEGGGVSLRVRIKVAGGVGEVRLHVAVNDPLAYPRAIKMVEKGELLRELKADTWQAGESLVGNLVELFSEIVAAGEVAEAYEKSGMEGGGEEDEEEWNAEWCFVQLPLIFLIARIAQMSSTLTSKPTLVMGRAPPPPAAAAAATRDVHSIPCKTSYTGPAPVEGYLMREKSEMGTERTALRGS
ncbi:hypothetical protein PENTCL1PPCAC_25794, partial [Pristionchus entomophagus]